MREVRQQLRKLDGVYCCKSFSALQRRASSCEFVLCKDLKSTFLNKSNSPTPCRETRVRLMRVFLSITHRIKRRVDLIYRNLILSIISTLFLFPITNPLDFYLILLNKINANWYDFSLALWVFTFALQIKLDKHLWPFRGTVGGRKVYGWNALFGR